jgi:hypothetical protein
MRFPFWFSTLAAEPKDRRYNLQILITSTSESGTLNCDVPVLKNEGYSQSGSLRDTIIEVMTYNTSHTRKLY